MVSQFDSYSNGDGTYNGVAMLADLSGLSREEILWTFNRIKQLRQVEGKSKEEALGIVKAESKNRPWMDNGKKA